MRCLVDIGAETVWAAYYEYHDIDENPEIAQKYGVMSIPTIISGLWGMNVFVPLAEIPHGFAIIVAATLIICIAALYVRHKRKML